MKKITKKMFREHLNNEHQKRVDAVAEKLHALPKKFIQREVDMHAGNGIYHARTRKQGDYLYSQDPEMFNRLFEEWKKEQISDVKGGLDE